MPAIDLLARIQRPTAENRKGETAPRRPWENADLKRVTQAVQGALRRVGPTVGAAHHAGGSDRSDTQGGIAMDPRRSEPAPDKVAIYIRWSTEDQGEGTTLDVQLEGCRHYLLSQGWEVRQDLIVIDDGHSGATLQRPGLTRLRSLVRQGAVECVVVYKLDRLSRSVADTARLCMDEWDGICCVKSAREPIDTTSQAGRMFFYTLMNYAEWERSVIRDRTHSGRLRRAQEGRSPGITAPYGYRREPGGGFVAVPHEAAIVRRIFDRYRCGAGVLGIANGLNQEGITFRSGRRWHAGTVAYMLSNAAYAGDLVWGARVRNPRYGKRPDERLVLRREEPLVRALGAFPPLVTREEFAQVQQIKRARAGVGQGGPARSRSSGYLLTGLLRCGLCGAPMVGQHNHPQSRAGYYYGCITRRDKGASVCPAPPIQCHLLDREIPARLRALGPADEIRRRCLDALAGDAYRRAEAARTEAAGIARELALVAERERRICREYAAAALTIEEFRRLSAVLAAERGALQQARTSASGEVCTGTVPDITEMDLWDVLDVPRRKQLLRHFAERIAAVRSESVVRCEITWKSFHANTRQKGAPSHEG